MHYNIDDIRKLIDECILKLVEALDSGEAVDPEVLLDAQMLLAEATGHLSELRRLEETMRKYEESNIIRFPIRR